MMSSKKKSVIKKNVNCCNQIRNCKQAEKKRDIKWCCELTMMNNASKRCTNDATTFIYGEHLTSYRTVGSKWWFFLIKQRWWSGRNGSPNVGIFIGLANCFRSCFSADYEIIKDLPTFWMRFYFTWPLWLKE